MAGEIIRLGDPTSHGGKVVEGSLVDICHGKPIAFVGHKTSCPKCKGTFPIIEGAPTTTFYGKGVALAGMKTACGAVLIATQFTDVVETGSSSASGDASRSESRRGKSAASGQVMAESQSPPSLPAGADPTDLEQYFEAVDATGAPVELVYRINSGNCKLTEAPLSPSGTTQAFPLDLETELVFWKTRA
jgi:uncharacterized Zn-binding protein involved in type VI secretion